MSDNDYVETLNSLNAEISQLKLTDSELTKRLEKLEENSDKTLKSLDELIRAIVGDISKPSDNSILLRIDRLETKQRNLIRIVWGTCSALGALMLEKLKAIL